MTHERSQNRSQLPDLLERLQRAVIEELDTRPGGHLVYTRPHESARARRVPRMSKSGERIGGFVRIPPDCPRPVKGRCECPPEGAWRPTAGSVRGDALVDGAYFVDDIGWVDDYYRRGDDGYWRCVRPHARAIQRLRGSSPRRHRVLVRLIGGESVDEAWEGQGRPGDPLRAAIGILDQVFSMAEEEARADYTRPPRRQKTPERSEAQQRAEQQEAPAAARASQITA